MEVIRNHSKSHSISLWESIQNLEKLEITRSIDSIKSFIKIILEISSLIKTSDLSSLIETTIKLSTLKSHYENLKGEE